MSNIKTWSMMSWSGYLCVYICVCEGGISTKAWINLNLTSSETPEQISHRLPSCTNPLPTHIPKGKKEKNSKWCSRRNDFAQKQWGLSDLTSSWCDGCLFIPPSIPVLCYNLWEIDTLQKDDLAIAGRSSAPCSGVMNMLFYHYWYPNCLLKQTSCTDDQL